QLLWRAFRKATNHARMHVCNLAPRRRLWTDHAMLYGISPALLPQPKDWPANARVCGQWPTPATAWSPPEALTQFLAAGEPPLYTGFGSMVGFKPTSTLEAIVAAVGDRRALFYPGWSGLDTSKLPHNFFVL